MRVLLRAKRVGRLGERRGHARGGRLKFKEDASGSFLKTLSAFADYGGGSILFGVADDGRAVGLASPVASCLDIENRVNGAVFSRPEYSLEAHEADSVVELRVRPGASKPHS